jgi:hypothetical protein
LLLLLVVEVAVELFVVLVSGAVVAPLEKDDDNEDGDDDGEVALIKDRNSPIVKGPRRPLLNMFSTVTVPKDGGVGGPGKE